jgi:hypothetical protein
LCKADKNTSSLIIMAHSDGNLDPSGNSVPEHLKVPDYKFGDTFEARDFLPSPLLAPPSVAQHLNPNPATPIDRLL